jgi:uncharacterized protein involved in exopolysaccharide biosynthesis
MGITQLVAALLRRWYVLALVFVFVVVGGIGLVKAKPPPYAAKGVVVLLAPSAAVDGSTASNPYLDFGSSLQTTATVVSAQMLDNSTVNALREAGFSAQSYTVSPAGDGTAPLIQVTANDPNADIAFKDMHLLLAEVPKVLQQIQKASGAPLNEYITTNTVSTDKQAKHVYKTLEKLLALLFIVGAIIAIWLARLVDSWAIRRSQRSADQKLGAADRQLDHAPAPSAPVSEIAPVDAESESPEAESRTGS